MATSYGDISTPIQQPQKIEITSTLPQGTSAYNSAGTKTKTIICLWGDRDTNTPAQQTPFETDSPYLLGNATQEEMPGGLCKITLTYQATYTSIPTTTYTENTSQVEVPIQEHPNFVDWADDWDDSVGAFKPGTSKYGISSYVLGTSTVTKTEYFNSRPAHRFASVGKLQTPGGDYSDSGQYLIISSNRSNQGAFWVVVTTYQYSAKAYDTDIYSAA